jgi:hypothetical protein
VGYLDLYNKLENISSREDLAIFVRSIVDDYLAHKNDWENTTIDKYLEALAAVIEGIESGYQNTGKKLPDRPNWKFFGEILLAATAYE